MRLFRERARELSWYHAAPMLFGDWGTSRLYVLGIAFALAGYGALYYLIAASVLMVFVGWAYTHICRIFPEGGGVYNAVRQKSPFLAVTGGLLLLGGYAVMASLSALVGFHYLGLSQPWIWTVGLLILIGILHAHGPRRLGNPTILAAILTAGFFLIIAAFALPRLGAAQVVPPTGGFLHNWGGFVCVILALSGVESIANMTGLLKQPVARTSALAIWVVLLEVALVNVVLGFAMCAIPNLQGHTESMVKVLAQHYVGTHFAHVASVVFALLLFTATDTAMGAMVSMLYLMGCDGELPRSLTSLNRFEAPWVTVLLVTALAVVTFLIHTDVLRLAPLYALGVAGAITINLGSCAFGKVTGLSQFQQILMRAITVLMCAITVTLVLKPHVLCYVLCILGIGFGARLWVKGRRMAPLPEPNKDVSAEESEPPRVTLPPEQPRLLVASRGAERTLRYAVEEAQRRGAALFVLFVREPTIPFPTRESTAPRLQDDTEAQAIFQKVQVMARDKGVPVIPIYESGVSAAEAILDHAVTLGVEALIMGVSKRGALWHMMKGDLLQEVMALLPEHITLLLQA